MSTGNDAVAANMLTPTQCWIILLLCIAAEVVGSVCVKLSDSYRNVVPSVLLYVFFALSMGFFPYALVHIDLGTAYAIWSGVGMAATCAAGIALFDERATLMKLAGVLIVILGVVILQIASSEDENDDVDAGISKDGSVDQDGDPSESSYLLNGTEIP